MTTPLLSHRPLAWRSRWLAGITALVIGLALPAQAQLVGYLAADASASIGTYTDLGTTGTAVPMANPDDANSAPQPIGFTFQFAGQSFTDFVMNTNGFIRLGTAPPSAAALFYPDPVVGQQGGLMSSPDPADVNLIAAFNADLQPVGTADFRVATTGTAPNRVCTIQWKNVADETLVGVDAQLTSAQFQIKLYETTNIVEIAYGNWVGGTGTDAYRAAEVGLKADTSSSVVVRKLSTAAMTVVTFLDGGYDETQTAGNSLRFNYRSTVMPNPTVVYRFVPNTCPRITGLSVGNLSSSSATVSFSPSSAATGYTIFYGPAGFTPGGAGSQSVTTSTPSATLTGLPGGSVSVYVQSVCGTGSSTLVGPLTFCLLSAPAPMPYAEFFDVGGGNVLPCGIGILNADGDTARWRNIDAVANNVAVSTPPNEMRIETNNATPRHAKDDWFFTPELALAAGQQYQLTFQCRIGGGVANPERLEVKVGSATTVAGMTTQIFNDTAITAGGFPNLMTAVFTAPATGPYYIGFHAYSRPVGWRLYVDDVQISVVTGLAESPLARAVGVFPNPTTGRVLITLPLSVIQTASLRVLDGLGREVYRSAGPLAERQELDLSALPAGLYTVQAVLDGQLATRRLSLVP